MDKSGKIRESIRKIAGTHNPGNTFFTAEVKSVDDETCTIIWNDLEISDVRLGAVVNGNANNIKIKPTTGSMVAIADMSHGTLRDLAVIGWSEIDSITINGGTLGGLVKIQELVNNLQAIKSYVETMKTAVSAGLMAIGVGSAANGTTGKTAFDSAMAGTSITLKDMEDKSITH